MTFYLIVAAVVVVAVVLGVFGVALGMAADRGDRVAASHLLDRDDVRLDCESPADDVGEEA